MKTIKINFSGFWKNFNKEQNTFTEILRERYNVIVSDTPDYLFYSGFDREFINFKGIRIFFTGECVSPDFNLCDYAMAFDNISFGDRYVRVPLYEVFHYRNKYECILQNNIPNNVRASFCSIVVSNDQGMKERLQIVELLNAYKRVDSGGRLHNNVGGPVKDKFEFDKKYKFSIAFENNSYKGYTTEKIMEAFAAGTIPIYYGNPEIGKEFNTKAFINVHDYANIEEVVKRVIEVDQNDKLYNSIKNEPIISGAHQNLNYLRDFLFSIFDQPIGSAFRRPSNTRTQEKEAELRLYAAYFKYWGAYMNKIKALIRRIKNKAI